jgi:hypothetical protein
MQVNSSAFAVGVTNNNPSIVQPTSGNYSLCGLVPDGLVANGSTVSIQCPAGMPPSRYLIVRKQSPGSMAICELEVYAQGLFNKRLYIWNLCTYRQRVFWQCQTLKLGRLENAWRDVNSLIDA